MPPENRNKKSAEEWLARAKSCLAIATQAKPAIVFWEDLCFNAQQASEKAIKAIFIAHGRKFLYTHDLGKLLNQLATELKMTIPSGVAASTALSDYALSARYPGLSEPATREDHRDAVEIAEAVMSWAENLIQ